MAAAAAAAACIVDEVDNRPLALKLYSVHQFGCILTSMHMYMYKNRLVLSCTASTSLANLILSTPILMRVLLPLSVYTFS